MVFESSKKEDNLILLKERPFRCCWVNLNRGLWDGMGRDNTKEGFSITIYLLAFVGMNYHHYCSVLVSPIPIQIQTQTRKKNKTPKFNS